MATGVASEVLFALQRVAHTRQRVHTEQADNVGDCLKAIQKQRRDIAQSAKFSKGIWCRSMINAKLLELEAGRA